MREVRPAIMLPNPLRAEHMRVAAANADKPNIRIIQGPHRLI